MADDTSTTTRDRLLGGRVVLDQPAAGLRATTDAVLLAAAVRAGPLETVLDLGCGTGAAALCLAARVGACRIVGLEADRDLAARAKANAAVNGVSDRVTVVTGAVPGASAPELDRPFDHVMTNPPYLPAARSRTDSGSARGPAMVESVDLSVWLGYGLARLRPKGVLSVVHRADRLDDLLAALMGEAGDIAILPLWPDGSGTKPARRVLVNARKGVKTPLRLLPGLVLHGPGGAYSEAAEAILRDGRAIAWA
jgi:tRNA1(Val) A37 N6-methylase TrmN6